MASSEPTRRLLAERGILFARLQAEREQLERLRLIADELEERTLADQRLLDEIDSLLGLSAQLRLESLDDRLRGQRLEEIAITVFREEAGVGAVVHYREWFEMVRARGHRIAGKNPLATFLAQINRSNAIEGVGGRTGRYRLAAALSP